MSSLLGTVISDEETPSFEKIRFKLKPGQDVKPGGLVEMRLGGEGGHILVARVSAAREWNPNEAVGVATVRDTLNLPANYPKEEDSTTIYRIAEAELIEEITKDGTRAPETLPRAGTEVIFADQSSIVASLGLSEDSEKSLYLGDATGGTDAAIHLKREAIQRHFFIGGTTGSGKSYAMGVLAEELIEHKLPVIFIDTQNEYSRFVEAYGGNVCVPGEDFKIPFSALTEGEFLALLPKALTASSLQTNIVSNAFINLSNKNRDFSVACLIAETKVVTEELAQRDREGTAKTIASRLGGLRRNPLFGSRPDWQKVMRPCLSIKCSRLHASELQWVATTILRELQNLRLEEKVPPYVVVIDEAHLFVPEGHDSPCKQIIREGVRIGRHHGICVVLMTQSPVDIDKRAIRQCNTRMVFALEPDQLDAIRGVKSDASDEMLRALPKMPRGTCVLSGTYESVKHAVMVKVRKRHKEDSEGGKAPDIFAEVEGLFPKTESGG